MKLLYILRGEVLYKDEFFVLRISNNLMREILCPFQCLRKRRPRMASIYKNLHDPEHLDGQIEIILMMLVNLLTNMIEQSTVTQIFSLILELKLSTLSMPTIINENLWSSSATVEKTLVIELYLFCHSFLNGIFGQLIRHLQILTKQKNCIMTVHI